MGCRSLKSVTFEECSALQSVGKGAFAGTPLRPESVVFPAGVDLVGAFVTEVVGR